MTADVDSLVAMFDDLIKGGLVSHGTLIDEGYGNVVASMFLRPEPGRDPSPSTANAPCRRLREMSTEGPGKRTCSESGEVDATTPQREHENID